MDLRSYLRFLRDNWDVVAACTLVGVAVAMCCALLTTPRFAATSDLFLATPGYSSLGSLATNESSPYAADEFSQQRALTYVRLASRVDLARRVTERLKPNVTPDELAASTSAVVQPDTVLLSVTVESDSAAQAKALTDAVTAELANDIRSLEMPTGIRIPNVDPVVTQAASLPTEPIAPNIPDHLIVGAAIGFLIGITAAAWPRRRQAIRGVDAVEQLTGKPVFGPRWNDAKHDVAAALAELDAVDGDAPGRVLGVASVVRGDRNVATVAGSLAAEFATADARVVLVEVDAGSAESAASDGVGLAGVLGGEASLADAIRTDDADGALNVLAGPGPQNPVPLLASVKFAALVDELRQSFSLVVLHSSDFFQYAESSPLKDAVDCVVLTAPSGSTQRHQVTKAANLLAKWNTPLLGTILTPDRGDAGAESPGKPVERASKMAMKGSRQ